jgi:hypothetical protein
LKQEFDTHVTKEKCEWMMSKEKGWQILNKIKKVVRDFLSKM